MQKITMIFISVLMLTLLGCTAKETKYFQSENGIKISANFYESENLNSPTVLILPGRRGAKERASGIAKQFQKANMNAIVVDYYRLATLPSNTPRKQWQKVFEERGETTGIIENEVVATLNFLRSQPKVDPDRIGILGVSMGTWIGFVTMSQYPELKSLTMLSPRCAVTGHSYNTYKGTQALADAFGDRHLLLIGAQDDRSSSKFPSAVEAADYLVEVMPNAKITKKYYPGNTHGYEMYSYDKELQDFIINWFTETL